MPDERGSRISGAGCGISPSNARNRGNSSAFDTSSEQSDNENEQSDAATNSTSRENYEPVMGNAIGADTINPRGYQE